LRPIGESRKINLISLDCGKIKPAGFRPATTPALRHAISTVNEFREFAAAGGFLSYGSSLTGTFTLVGNYTGRILKGENPADLPGLGHPPLSALLFRGD
jgi:hypothetical protein